MFDKILYTLIFVFIAYGTTRHFPALDGPRYGMGGIGKKLTSGSNFFFFFFFLIFNIV